MDREKRTHNSTYPKVAVQWLNQALCFYQSLCLVDSEVLRNRHLRVAAKRCASYNKTLHMIGEVKNEIQKAIDKLNLTETDIQLLDNILNETIYNECVAYFVKSGDRRWWWENFKFQTFSITEFENPFNYIDKIIPLTSENVWFVVEDDNEPFTQFMTVIQMLLKILLVSVSDLNTILSTKIKSGYL
ncbi:MAG: hypothetical protein IPL98_07950 [Saprospiraceae bacterium]|nr:hypothetical protein [Saprospiraceae bacterium]